MKSSKLAILSVIGALKYVSAPSASGLSLGLPEVSRLSAIDAEAQEWEEFAILEYKKTNVIHQKHLTTNGFNALNQLSFISLPHPNSARHP